MLLRHFKNVLRTQGGFTLVEMMIALLVFSIGVVALSQALPNGMQLRDRARRLSVATNMAQDHVERLRSLPFNDAALGNGDHTDAGNPLENTYTRRWTVENDSPIPGMKRVTVVVSFFTTSPDSQVTLTTQITR
jgi:type IV pilus assembly protein PilV